MKLMTITEVAAMRGLSRQRIYDLIKAGRIRAELIGSQYLIRERDAKLWQPLAPHRPRKEQK